MKIALDPAENLASCFDLASLLHKLLAAHVNPVPDDPEYEFWHRYRLAGAEVIDLIKMATLKPP
jgi:hypothetical protein